jgi:hypothetical protein
MDMRDQVQKFERSTSDVSRSGQLLSPKIPEIFRNKRGPLSDVQEAGPDGKGGDWRRRKEILGEIFVGRETVDSRKSRAQVRICRLFLVLSRTIFPSTPGVYLAQIGRFRFT